MSFGGSPVPTIADGVTLYFTNFPEDEESEYVFIQFIKKLRKHLRDIDNHYHFNLMLHMDAIGRGIYKDKVLKQLVPSNEKGKRTYEQQDFVDNYLVFIGEPSTQTKKHLREKVENIFDGVQRRIMLQKLIPVITPVINSIDHDNRQLKDDIIYMKQNFGGIGFWTIPASEGSGVSLGTCLKEILPGSQRPPTTNIVNSKLEKNYRKEGAEPVSGYQNFVTLHRWGGRILFDILLVTIAVYALLSVFLCFLRTIFARFFWWFMVIILFSLWLFFSLLYFDPSWRNLAEGNLILFLTILAIAVFAVIGFVKKSRKGNLP
jgi:hypothetical protein